MSTSIVRWQRLLAVMVILVIVTASFGLQMTTASAKPGPEYQTLKGNVQTPVGFAVSQPLSALAEKMQAPETAIDGTADSGPVQEFVGGKQIPHQVFSISHLPGLDSERPMIEPEKRLFDDPPSPSVDWQWAGLSQGINRAWYSYGVYPPDTQGDLSATHYIQVVNIQIAIWDLTQSQQWTTAPKTLFVGPINILWQGSGLTACENSEDGDPVVVYDEYADRWLVSQFEVSTGYYECIAVSQSGDPMGPWNLYQYSFPVMNDYPKFGVWHDGYYMSINQFNPGWAGQGVAVFDKVAMQAGNPAAGMIYIDTSAACVGGTELECYLGGMLPSDADGTSAPTGNQVFMQFDDDAWGYSADQLQLWEMVPNWGTGTATFSHLADLPTAAFDSEVCASYSRNCIAQLGTSVGLDSISDRLMYRLQWRDFGSYQAMVVNHTVDVSGSYPKGQAGVRWYELRDTGSGWAIYQQGNVAPDTANRWMASAAMDDVGNIAIGYSVSDATMYPGIRYTVHLASDPLGTTRTETNLVTGGGAQTGTGYRWGDYSMMSVYPEGSGGCDFVYTQEYLRGTTPAEWYTWLGWFHNASCYSGDVTSPETYINSTDTSPGSTTAKFMFYGDDGSGPGVNISGYECSLDGAAFTACTPQKIYTGLSLGTHTFEVRAKDSSGNFDWTPASFTWNISLTTLNFISQGANDGHIIESTEASGLGGLTNPIATMLSVGDYSGDRQVMGFLSFDTSALPDTAVVTGASLQMRYAGAVGTNPYNTHGPLLVDINSPFFGAGVNLLGTDFQSAADSSSIATCGNVAVASWYSCDLTGGFGFFNVTGTTQFRLHFTLEDNDDMYADLVKFYSGNYLNAAYRPVLVIQYYVP